MKKYYCPSCGREETASDDQKTPICYCAMPNFITRMVPVAESDGGTDEMNEYLAG
jgi:hypothetical protein